MFEDQEYPIDLAIVKEAFSRDRFATHALGAVVEKVDADEVVCSVALDPVHFNAHGNVMGGAIFTLADFALAIACNIHETPTVSISNTINFLSGVKGTRLYAHARTNRSGRQVGFYTVTVNDDLGTDIAVMEAVCSRRPRTE